MFQRYIYVIVLLLAGAMGASASVVKGVVTDLAGEPLPQATVRLLRNDKDSTFVSATASDLDGRFRLEGVKSGRYLVQATYLGYFDAVKPVKVGSADLTIDTLKLRESSIVLKEATAIGIATPVKVMEDTIEYNASSYTTPPNAVVSDLLKRLPGVEVESDGSIKAQGQTVKKILIDGEEFFSDDPAVASKNIPVNMIKNAQVINRKSDLARMTGVDDGEDETVINLTVKPGMKNGWFGQAEAGYGTDDTYKASFIVNRFINSNQFTLLGNANNINDAGFTDNNGQRFRRFGGNTGINTTRSLGFNFNVGNSYLRVGGNILYSYNDRYNTSKTHRINLLPGGNTTDDNSSRSWDKGHNVRGDFRLKWDPDSFNTLEFRPNVSININDSRSNSTGANFDEAGAITDSRNIDKSHGKSFEFGGRLIYNHKFRSRPGRSFSISANYTLSNVHERENAWSRNAYWDLNRVLDAIEGVNEYGSLYEDYQYITNHTWNNGINSRLSWVEPIGNAKNGNFLEFSYMMNYRWNNADKIVKHDPISEYLTEEQAAELRAADWASFGFDERWAGLGDLIYDPDNSNRFRNDYFNQSVRAGYKKVSSKYTLNAGLSFNPQMSKSVNLTNSAKNVRQWVYNFAPFARLNYKFTKQTTLNVNYNGRSSQPSIAQMQPVEDSSDPMNIIQGNPNLKPSFAHNLRVRFQTFDSDRQQSIMVMGHASYTQNAIATNVVTDRQTGGRYTTYENVDGNWNAGFFSLFSRPLGHSKLFTFNNYLNANYSQTDGFISGQKNTAGRTGFGESFAIAYRPTDLELELRPNYRLQYNTNSIKTSPNSTVHTYGASFNGTWYSRFGLVLSTDLTYSSSTGYSSGYDTDEWMLNASISYMFLRGKNATFAIKGYDLLNQRKSISRSETAQAISDISRNVLGRYVMATFTYKFSTFAGGKAPTTGNEDFMRQGPPGGGPGGHPGGGRPGGPGPR